MWSFWVEANLWVFFLYRLCISVGDAVIKSGVWDPINKFNPVTLLCLFQVGTWISNVRCCLFFVFSEDERLLFALVNWWPLLIKHSFHDYLIFSRKFNKRYIKCQNTNCFQNTVQTSVCTWLGMPSYIISVVCSDVTGALPYLRL